MRQVGEKALAELPPDAKHQGDVWTRVHGLAEWWHLVATSEATAQAWLKRKYNGGLSVVVVPLDRLTPVKPGDDVDLARRFLKTPGGKAPPPQVELAEELTSSPP